jgi:hypothetical protein
MASRMAVGAYRAALRSPRLPSVKWSGIDESLTPMRAESSRGGQAEHP